MSDQPSGPQQLDDIWGVIERTGETGSVRFERRLPTSAAHLWQVVTAPDRLARWFCAVTGELELGGVYRADMGSDGLVTGRVLACDPPRFYRVSWDEGHEQQSVIEVSVEPGSDSPETAMLRLVHTGLPAPTLNDYGAGWQGYLEVLESEDGGRSEWSTERYRELLPAYRRRFPDAG